MNPLGQPTYTVVTCHFGDTFWIEHMLKQIDALSGPEIVDVIVVDQSRLTSTFLQGLPRVSEVISFPLDEDQAAILGHDHPSSLNRALRQINFRTSHVLVMDSDCFPIDGSWISHLQNVTLASDPSYGSLSHPCLMCFPVSCAASLDFSQGISTIGIDTGRLVALQISQLGLPINWAKPTVANHGYRGHYYLEGSTYHHGSASFVSSSDPRLTRQVDARREQSYKKKIAAGNYHFSLLDLLGYKLAGLRRKITRVLKKAR
ncbi:MAG: hypothetical protein F2806_05880 [Actinobacteria bacterium]|nr:hypothetical protein [Actinomycetota bacterium]